MLKLTKRKEPLYALSGFGPNFLNLFVAVYLQNAVIGQMPWISLIDPTDPTTRLFVTVAIFSALILVTRILDALTNIPIAHLCDRTKSRWGRRRPCCLIGMCIMIPCYICLCNPLIINPPLDGSTLNACWFAIILIIYLCGSTLCMESFYGSFPEITYDTQARIRLTSWKAFYDTIQYSIGYALLPVVLSALNKNGIVLQTVALCLTPLLLTMLIPIFLIKEPSSYFIINTPTLKKKKLKIQANTTYVGFWESIKISLTNKNFLIWASIFAVFYFGLDLFLLGQGSLAGYSLKLNGWQTSVMNTAAFAPIPLMLLISNKVIKKYGFKVSFIVAIISFMIAMSSFMVAHHAWTNNVWISFSIATVGSTVGSYGITTFFSAPYFVPAQLASEAIEKNKKVNSSMFFGVQGIIVAISAALNDVVWINVSQLGNIVDSEGNVTGNDGTGAHVMTYIVLGVCTAALVAAIFLPRYFKDIGKKAKVKVKPYGPTDVAKNL